jgi:hypothetical protein
MLSNFSNDKMVGLIKNKISESENAAVALVFDDKLIILDEDNNKFYTVDYKVEDKALILANWEPIELIPDNDTRLEELSGKFFDVQNEDEIAVKDLVEAFRLKFSDEPVKELINRTALDKKSIVESNSKIKALREVRQTRALFIDDIIDIMEDPKIKALASRISENSPIQGTITSINFKQPVSVALFEESSNRVVNLSEKKKCKMRSGNVKKKVQNMWTSESFKEDIKSMIEEMTSTNDVKKVLEDFVNQHIELLILEENELEDLILKTALMIGESKKAESLSSLFKEYYNLEETKKSREEFVSRNNLSEEEEKEVPAEELAADEKKPEEKPAEKETSIDEDSINKILKVMNKIKDNLEEKTLEAKYVNSFINALEDAKVGSIGEGKLKEIVDFLNSIYEQAQEEKDSEEE